MILTRRVLFLLLVICCTIKSFSQKKPGKYEALLSGYVRFHETFDGLRGVDIYVASQEIGTVTDEYGYFELILPKGRFNVTISRLDLKPKYFLLDLTEDREVSFVMEESVTKLDAVTIVGEGSTFNLKSANLGKEILSIEKIKKIPAFLGEADVVKSMLLLPGVSSVGEASTGINVRGGTADQNLVLQDGVSMFNASHVFGFFSTFNSSMVQNATLYKGAIPARFGGRLSSVLDVSLKDGHFKDHHAFVSVGLAAASASFNGPVMEDKLSVNVGGRVTYAGWLLHQANEGNLANSNAAFQDGNLKLTYKLDEFSRLSYSGYLSRDDFQIGNDTTYLWVNNNHSLQLDHFFENGLFSRFRVFQGIYRYDVFDDDGFEAFEVTSKISQSGIQGHFEYDYNNDLTANFGISSTYYTITPGTQVPYTIDSGVDSIDIQKERALESAIYGEAEWSPSKNVNLRVGLRANHFASLGSAEVFEYEVGQPIGPSTLVDTTTYQSGEILRDFVGLSPRLSLTYIFDSERSIKFGYTRTHQYLHLITNTSSITPTDTWRVSGPYLKPSSGHQFSLGFYRNFDAKHIETSIEGYYKTSNNVTDFKDGAAIFMNENIEQVLLQGTGEAYGIEFLLKKNVGETTGWIGYTFSRSFRTINGEFREETINRGSPYPSNFDKPHDFTFTLNRRVGFLATLGANFVYNTGRPVTEPLGSYDISNITGIFNFSQRNQGRIPDYHRLDVSVTFSSRQFIDRKWKYNLIFALYNVYGRRNAYSVFFRNSLGSPPASYKLAVLGSPFPSVTFNLEF